VDTRVLDMSNRQEFHTPNIVKMFAHVLAEDLYASPDVDLSGPVAKK